jgi:hypothetical protein
MTRRIEKWCVPGYQASQKGRFSSSVALTPQFIARARGHEPRRVLALKIEVYDPVTHYQQVRDVWGGVRTPRRTLMLS